MGLGTFGDRSRVGLWSGTRKQADPSIGDRVRITWLPGVVATIEQLPDDDGLYLVSFGAEETMEVCRDDMTPADTVEMEET